MGPTVLALVASVLSELPGLITAGQDVINIIDQTSVVVQNAQKTGADPTAAEWEAIDSQIKSLKALVDGAG